MFDLKVKEFQDEVIRLANDSRLPISVIVLVLNDVVKNAQRTYELTVEAQKKELAEQQAEERKTEQSEQATVTYEDNVALPKELEVTN